MDSKETINLAVESLYQKIQHLNIQELEISDYNKKYLTKYQNAYHFYMFSYIQLLEKVLKNLKKPIAESSFVDYGGGCGMLSYLAKEIGFKEIIYNDIYAVSVEDVKVIASNLDLNLDYYIHGDTDAFISEIQKNKIQPDVICSFDVLEHIYDVYDWVSKIVKIDSKFQICSMTSANPLNPLVKRRLEKLHYISEYTGFGQSKGQKKSDLHSSFLEERKKMIQEKYPKLNSGEISFLAKETRGLYQDLIYRVAGEYVETGKISYKMKHPTNTCDPYTGNWTENLIDLEKYTSFIKKDLGCNVKLTNSKYGFSNNALLHLPKGIINQVISILGEGHLKLSPTYTLEVEVE